MQIVLTGAIFLSFSRFSENLFIAISTNSFSISSPLLPFSSSPHLPLFPLRRYAVIL